MIFGVGGFVGRYLLDEFTQNGYKAYGADIAERVAFCENYAKADILNAEEVQNLVARIQPDVIVNLAAISSVGQSWKIPQTTVQVNVVGSLNILEGVRLACPTAKVLFVGSSEEYAPSTASISEDFPVDATNPYGIAKVTQERFAEMYRENYGLRVYCVRPFNHTGAGQRDTFVLPSFCKQVAEIERNGKAGCIRVGNLAVKRDFSHVKDVVRAYRMIVESEDCTKIYNVGSGKAYSLEELLGYIVKLSNQPVTVEVDENKLRPNDIPVICCDNTRIREELGWEPKYSVFDALEEMFRGYGV